MEVFDLSCCFTVMGFEEKKKIESEETKPSNSARPKSNLSKGKKRQSRKPSAEKLRAYAIRLRTGGSGNATSRVFQFGLGITKIFEKSHETRQIHE